MKEPRAGLEYTSGLEAARAPKARNRGGAPMSIDASTGATNHTVSQAPPAPAPELTTAQMDQVVSHIKEVYELFTKREWRFAVVAASFMIVAFVFLGAKWTVSSSPAQQVTSEIEALKKQAEGSVANIKNLEVA